MIENQHLRDFTLAVEEIFRAEEDVSRLTVEHLRALRNDLVNWDAVSLEDTWRVIEQICQTYRVAHTKLLDSIDLIRRTGGKESVIETIVSIEQFLKEKNK